MELQLHSVNLQRFTPFLNLLVKCECSMVLLDKAGHFYSEFDSQNAIDKTTLFAWLTEQSLDWASLDTNHHFIQLPDQALLILSCIFLGPDQQQFWLATVLTHVNPLLLEQQKAELSKLIQSISACVAEDYLITLTIDGMAEELAVRYEELNLFYGLDNSQEYLANVSEYEALNLLLKKSTNYLYVDLIALYIPDQGILIHYALNENSELNLTLIFANLKGPLLHWMKANRETLVINRDIDTDWTDANLDLPYKIIAAPLLKENGNLAGILIMLNSLMAKDFSNSDRKLAEVLALESALLVRARHDSLTELLNRKGFHEKLETALKQVATNQSKCYALLVIDIDQFKVVNDVSGHKAGDNLLIQVGSLIRKELTNSDVIARLAADEFAVLLNNCSIQQAEQKAEQIRLIINQFRFVYDHKMHNIALSIGLLGIDSGGKNISDIFSAADLACQVAKEKGGNRIHIYHESDQELLQHEDQMQWISRINKALLEQRFELYRQRILALADNLDEEHYEILLRLRDEQGQLVAPTQFIPAAERFGLMTKIDRWVVKTALKKMVVAYASDANCRLVCSINLSGQSFCEPGFQEYLIDQVLNSRLPPASICLEITETVAVSNLSQAIAFMQAIKAIGCQFSLDDFGSGMSSFTYLKNLPVDYLKIDGYFVKTILDNKIDHAMVQAINQIGQVMGLKTIAEFVENNAILAELKNIGVNYGQGYGIAKPEPF
ncbi:MAG: EAL domain-containing protein [Methylococcales bacterium]